jgi:DNA-binding NarL/FixJ family response regulator
VNAVLRILLVDDHELFRAGLKLLLADLVDELEFVEASCCAAASELCGSGCFDLVLLDYHLPDHKGLQVLQLLREKEEQAVIVVLSAEDDPAVIRQVVDGGAAGFIPKSSSHAVMLAALRLVLSGGTYLPPHALATAASAAAPPPGALDQLTQRQLETLRLAVQGKANKVIARELAISEATVKAHLSASFRALGVKNRTEAVFVVAKSGYKI